MADKADFDGLLAEVDMQVQADEGHRVAVQRITQICKLLDLPSNYFDHANDAGGQAAETLSALISALVDARREGAQRRPAEASRASPSRMGRLGILAHGRENPPKGPPLAAHIAATMVDCNPALGSDSTVPKSKGSPSKILVVDDEPLLRFDAVDILERHGFQTVEAKNSAAALSILAGRNDVHVLFTDVNMPPGRDGIDLAHEVRRRWPKVLLIVTSGDSAHAIRKLPEEGQFISKPYSAGMLTGKIDGMMKKADGSSSDGFVRSAIDGCVVAT